PRLDGVLPRGERHTRVLRTMGQRSSLSSPESANPFAIKPMTGARNSTRLNYVPMGLVGRARAAGISNFASRVEPPADYAPPKWSKVLARVQMRGRPR